MAITASELVRQLKDIIRTCGDVPVYRLNGSSIVIVTHVALVEDPNSAPERGEKPHLAAVIK